MPTETEVVDGGFAGEITDCTVIELSEPQTPEQAATEFLRSKFSPEVQYRPIHTTEQEIAALLVEFMYNYGGLYL